MKRGRLEGLSYMVTSISNSDGSGCVGLWTGGVSSNSSLGICVAKSSHEGSRVMWLMVDSSTLSSFSASFQVFTLNMFSDMERI